MIERLDYLQYQADNILFRNEYDNTPLPPSTGSYSPKAFSQPLQFCLQSLLIYSFSPVFHLIRAALLCQDHAALIYCSLVQLIYHIFPLEDSLFMLKPLHLVYS